MMHTEIWEPLISRKYMKLFHWIMKCCLDLRCAPQNVTVVTRDKIRELDVVEVAETLFYSPQNCSFAVWPISESLPMTLNCIACSLDRKSQPPQQQIECSLSTYYKPGMFLSFLHLYKLSFTTTLTFLILQVRKLRPRGSNLYTVAQLLKWMAIFLGLSFLVSKWW